MPTRAAQREDTRINGREAYEQFLQVSAVRATNGISKAAMSGDEAIRYIDSAVFRKKFLERAEAEGVGFSHRTEPSNLEASRQQTFKRRWLCIRASGFTTKRFTLLNFQRRGRQ